MTKQTTKDEGGVTRNAEIPQGSASTAGRKGTMESGALPSSSAPNPTPNPNGWGEQRIEDQFNNHLGDFFADGGAFYFDQDACKAFIRDLLAQRDQEIGDELIVKNVKVDELEDKLSGVGGFKSQGDMIRVAIFVRNLLNRDRQATLEFIEKNRKTYLPGLPSYYTDPEIELYNNALDDIAAYLTKGEHE